MLVVMKSCVVFLTSYSVCLLTASSLGRPVFTASTISCSPRIHSGEFFYCGLQILSSLMSSNFIFK